MTKRGEPLPINQALNRPRAKLGLDLTAWMAIVFVCVTVFLAGFRPPAPQTWPTTSLGRGAEGFATLIPLPLSPNDGYLNSEAAALH